VSTPESAGPRLTAKGQATRERIVAAAARLMFERGVAGTSTDDVQAAAGVSASQLYHYFADKRALVSAVIQWQAEAVVGGQAPLFTQLDSLEGLRAWRDAIVALQVERECAGGCPLGTLSAELVETDPAARVDLDAAYRRWADGIAEGLHRMHRRAELPAETEPDRLAMAILAAAQGGLVLTQVARTTQPLEIALDTVIDHVAELVHRARAS
jgi:TetR/AcrR family transcriptional regulator, transcriptional repressor for nem operon